MIEAGFTSRLCVKSLICIEESTPNFKAQLFQGFESHLVVRFQVVGIIVVASQQTCRCNNETFTIRDGQSIKLACLLVKHI